MESKQNVPHFYLSCEFKIDKLLELRSALNEIASNDEKGNPVYKISVNDMIVKATAMALRNLISEEAPQGGVYAQDEVHNCIQQPLFLQQDKIGQNVDLPGTKRLPCIALSTSQK